MPLPNLISLNLADGNLPFDVAPEAVIGVQRSKKDAAGSNRTKVMLKTGETIVVKQGANAVVNAVNAARAMLA